ncbi:hypothetical protein YC2023_043568 [Brassica napus]
MAPTTRGVQSGYQFGFGSNIGVLNEFKKTLFLGILRLNKISNHRISSSIPINFRYIRWYQSRCFGFLIKTRFWIRENLFVQSQVIVYKEIIGHAIYDRYGEDMMMVEPIDFVFSKDAFKTTKAYLRDFMSAIKTEESKCTTRALEDWESFGYSLIKVLKIKELCDYTVDLEKYIEDIFIQMNNLKMYQRWNQRAKKIKKKEYLRKNNFPGIQNLRISTSIPIKLPLHQVSVTRDQRLQSYVTRNGPAWLTSQIFQEAST